MVLTFCLEEVNFNFMKIPENLGCGMTFYFILNINANINRKLIFLIGSVLWKNVISLIILEIQHIQVFDDFRVFCISKSIKGRKYFHFSIDRYSKCVGVTVYQS